MAEAQVKFSFLAAVFLAVPVAFLAVAFQSATHDASRTASQEDMRALAADFGGTWNIQESDDPALPGEKPLTGAGTESYSAEPGGMPFVERYHSMIGGQEAYETAYFWWDAGAKDLRGLWCSSFNGEGCSPFRFWREGNKWVMAGEYLSKGERLAWRENFVKQGPDAFVQTLEIGKRGEALKPAATINATRSR